MKCVTITAALAALSLSACATVTRGPNTAFEVNSTPSGATVSTSNGHQCPSTPCSIKMPRRSDFTVTVAKAGYRPATASVTNKMSGEGGIAMAGNVIVGGVPGLAIDAISGSTLDLTPNPLNVTLDPLGIGRGTATPALPGQVGM